MSDLVLIEVKKQFAALEVIQSVSLSVGSGEFVVFVGPSGCGKSTLLRMIAGLEDISSGEVLIGGRVVNDLPPGDRGIAMVFQSYALYPHMSVYENMAFGLRNAKLSQPEIDRRVQRAASILQIEPLLARLPRALSGGQRQRVAIGRAIVREPKVFLFDEPLSNLDASLRVQTRIEIARLHNALKATMIYVTHDQVEAMTLADRIVVLNAGRIEQVGTPLDLYDRPRNIFVAGFIGSPRMNFLSARQIGGAMAMRAATVGVRPEHLDVVDRASASIEGVVEIIEQLGEYVLVHVRVGDTMLVAKAERAARAEVGQTVGLSFDAAHVHLFDEAGEAVADFA